MAADNENTSIETTTAAISQEAGQLAEEFVGQWNRLVSTTNWEKGRIICQWREALMTEGASVTDYSDEAWAQLVGGVTSQHVGRLRRVYQRFGDQWQEYPGLYWSHFQAALDWDDAPMWLEGAIQNEWSVSQMRGKRWETLGTPESEQQAELEQSPEFDAPMASPTSTGQQAVEQPAAKSTSIKALTKPDSTDEKSVSEESFSEDDDEPTPAKPQAKRTRLNIDVELLPDDLADAFEQFKLAIIAQRREGWRDTTPETVCECLDALRELALAEA